jgi:hypothetical protein
LRVIILVKALPQPSKGYGETVCCAGVTIDRQWKRLFPVRFRHLSGDKAFSRWDWVSFNHRPPKRDTRAESCHVFEDSIVIDGSLAERERTRLLSPLIQPSAQHAAALGHSLALIRPKNPRFYWKSKSREKIEDERNAFRSAASQTSMFDKELSEIEPSSYDFRFEFEDGAGKHDYANGDWEAHAMFWNECRRSSAEQALKRMAHVFNEEYPKKGMAFALGNMASRPQTWQLLGVIRLDEVVQAELF